MTDRFDFSKVLPEPPPFSHGDEIEDAGSGERARFIGLRPSDRSQAVVEVHYGRQPYGPIEVWQVAGLVKTSLSDLLAEQAERIEREEARQS